MIVSSEPLSFDERVRQAIPFQGFRWLYTVETREFVEGVWDELCARINY